MIRSLLVALDLGPSAERVVARAAALPLAVGARVTLLHVVPAELPGGDRRLATGDARSRLAAWTARFPGGRRGVRTLVRCGDPAAVVAEVADRRRAGLVVLGRGGGRGLLDAFLGSTAERVLRACGMPVLVVRRPGASSYARPLLALDFDAASARAVELSLAVLADPRPRLDLLHAYARPYEGLYYPSLEGGRDAETLDRTREAARVGLVRLLAEAGLGSGGRLDLEWRALVRRGSARAVIEAAVRELGTDLLVMGTHGRTGLAHAFLGTVAGDVLRAVACDVLMVPPRKEA